MMRRLGVGRCGVAASLAAAGLALAACGSSSKPAAQGAGSSSGAPFHIEIVGTQTGAAAAPGGSGVISAASTVFDMVNASGGINGHRIEYSVQDDQSSVTTAAAIARKATGDNPVAILDGSLSTTLSARLPVYKEAQTTVMAAAGTSFPFYSWLYAPVQTASQAATSQASAAEQILGGSFKGKRIAIVYVQNPAGPAAVAQLTKIIEAGGGVVTGAQYQPPGAPSFASGAANIVSQKPDTVIDVEAAAGTIITAKALLTAGFTGPIQVGSAATDDKTLTTINSAQVFGLRTYNYPVPGSPLFEAGTKYGHTSDLTGQTFSQGWIQATALVKGLQKCGFPCTTKDLQNALNSLGSFSVPDVTFTDLPLNSTVHNFLGPNRLFKYDPATKKVAQFGDLVELGPPNYPPS